MNTKQKNAILMPLNLLYSVSPESALKILFRLKNGYKLDLKNPKTYLEKLQWIKLNYKNPILPRLVDKYCVREFVAERCPELLNDLLWSGFDANQIPWDELPNKFVLKTTHGSGFNIICKDKSKFEKNDAIKKLNNWMKEPFLKCYGEWFYGIEPPRIIVESYLDDGTGTSPTDYKFFCFDGEPKYICESRDRFTSLKVNVYDTEWNYMEGVSLGFPTGSPSDKPKNLEEMLKYARLLSKGFPHVRVDLYDLGDKICFGEMTFTHGAGFDGFKPYEFDLELGKCFKLPSKGN